MILNLLKMEQVDNYKDQFSHIIYKIANKNKIIVENCEINNYVVLDEDEIIKYITFSSHKNCNINWFKLYDDTFMKINQSEKIYIKPLFEEDIKWCTLNYIFSVDNDRLQRIHYDATQQKNILQTDNFLILASSRKSRHKIYKRELKIACRLPIFKTYIRFKQEYDKIKYNSLEIFIKFRNKLYKYPYGNVSNMTNQLCLGDSIISNFDSIFDSLITNIGNNDYDFLFKKNSDYMKITLSMDNIKSSECINYIDFLYFCSQLKTEKDIDDNLSFIEDFLIPLNREEYDQILITK